jgi:hypothetical protein
MKKKAAAENIKAKVPSTIKIEYVDFASLKRATYNARKADEEQINAICRSIYEFGVVDPLIVRRDDNLILGGHQRRTAIEKLIAGEFFIMRDGKREQVKWELPDGKVPVVFLDGIDDTRAKMLNLALNKATGDWDYEALPGLLKSLSAEVPLDDLVMTGFSFAEITDYVDAAGAGGDDGHIPQPSPKAPKLELDFSSAELRDAVKAAITSGTKKGELGGDALARTLGVKAKRPRRAA